MKGLLCIFTWHKWIHIVNITVANTVIIGKYEEIGLWQCSRCKEISKGKSNP